MDYSQLLYVYWKSPLYIENRDDPTTLSWSAYELFSRPSYIYIYIYIYGSCVAVIVEGSGPVDLSSNHERGYVEY